MHAAHSHLSRSHPRRFQSNEAPLGARRWTELSNIPAKRARRLATIRCRFKLEIRDTGFARLVERVVSRLVAWPLPSEDKGHAFESCRARPCADGAIPFYRTLWSRVRVTGAPPHG